MRIREMRKANGLPQKVIASYLHLCQSTYAQYEAEQRPIPVDLLIQLALFYDTSTDYLLGLTNQTKPYPRPEGR